MTKPRSYYVDSKQARYYHVTSRCVRRAWLLDTDPLTQADNQHRKPLFLDHLKHLCRFFSVDLMGFAIMSNHFHLVLRYDPLESKSWSVEEVARRWCATFNGLPFDKRLFGATQLSEFSLKQTLRYHEIVTDPGQAERCRQAVGSLSRFMQHLKQPFSVWANHEDNCKGHFFESRFYSGALLTEDDLLACMSYVDLNPVEAGIAESLRQSENTSVHERLLAEKFDPEKLEAYLAPLWTEPERKTVEDTAAPCSLKRYIEQLNLAIAYMSHPSPGLVDKMEGWMARLVNRERGTRRNHPPPFFDYA